MPIASTTPADGASSAPAASGHAAMAARHRVVAARVIDLISVLQRRTVSVRV
jgi:hypothetical protein